jgi:hypothetical protein
MMMMAQDMTEQNGHGMVEVVETTDENGVVHYFERIDEMEVDGQAMPCYFTKVRKKTKPLKKVKKATMKNLY